MSSSLVRIRKGMTAVFAGQFLLTAGNILVVPVYLAFWSPTRYGEWLAMFSLASYMFSLDPGIRLATVNRTTQAYSRGDLEEYARYQHSSFLLFLVLAIFGSIFLALAVWNLPVHAWLGFKLTSQSETRWVIWILGIQMLWSLPAGFITAVYRTNGHFSVSQWLSNIRQFSALGLVVLVLAMGGGGFEVALSQLLPLLVILYAVWDVRRRFPELMPGVSSARWSSLKDMLPAGLSFALIDLALVFSFQGSVILISNFLGGAAVALFATTRTLVNLTRRLVLAAIGPLWPELTALEARGDHERLCQMHRILVVGITGISVAVSAVFWFEGGEVISVWTRGKLVPDMTLLRLLVLYAVLQSPWTASSSVLKAANRHASIAWLIFFSSVGGLALAGLLIGKYGVWALPIGLMAGEALLCYHWVVKRTCQLIHEDYGKFSWRFWSGFAAVGFVSMAAAWCGNFLIGGHFIFRWAGSGLITLVAAMFSSWWLWLEAGDKAILRERLVSSVPLSRFLFSGNKGATPAN